MMQRLAISLLLLFSVPAPLTAETHSSVVAIERDDVVGLANSKTRLLWNKKSGALSLAPEGGSDLLSNTLKVPLWSMEVTAAAGAKPTVITADMASKVTVETKADSLQVTYTLDAAEVVVEARMVADFPMIRWRIEVVMKDQASSLWSVTFPQFAVAAFDAAPEANEMVVPYRRGQTRLFGKGGPKGDTDLPYPGASAKFQFMAAYGKTSGHGFYYATEDGEGYNKSFQQKNRPANDAVILASQHFPANRGAGVHGYHLPYEVVTGPFQGDWWQAARLYREWWVKQVWASKGLLAQRKDIPQWLIHSPIATRPSTTKPERTVANNVTSITALSEALGGLPFFGVWYGYPMGPPGAKSSDEGGLGHLWPPKAGLVEAVHGLADKGVRMEAYIQSMICDDSVINGEAEAIAHAVTLDPQGKPVPYGSGASPHLLAMCRNTEWWQHRLVELSQQAVRDFGFAGVYLDSFGKGAPECFAKDHGHPIAGGNAVIAGQRELAQKVRTAIRAINPEAIMSGEDSIEAFRDLLDVSLYSVNVMKNYVPVYRTVWGDYSLGHGRVLGPGKANDCLIPELAALFLEGTIPGRLYGESPNPFLLQPEFAKEFGFMKKLAAYTEHGLPYLRLGEYLHPLDLGTAVPVVSFTESCENQVVQVPSILNSVTRSHADGSVAVVLVNIGATAQLVSLPIDPALCKKAKAQLLRMDEAGKLEPLATREKPWRQALTLQPLEVAFLVLK